MMRAQWSIISIQQWLPITRGSAWDCAVLRRVGLGRRTLHHDVGMDFEEASKRPTGPVLLIEIFLK